MYDLFENYIFLFELTSSWMSHAHALWLHRRSKGVMTATSPFSKTDPGLRYITHYFTHLKVSFVKRILTYQHSTSLVAALSP